MPSAGPRERPAQAFIYDCYELNAGSEAASRLCHFRRLLNYTADARPSAGDPGLAMLWWSADQPTTTEGWAESGMRLLARNNRGSPLDRYLLPLEDELLSTRMHPRILLAPVGVVLAGLITAALLNSMLSGNGYAIDVIWLVWAILMLWLVLKIAYWFTTWYAVTSYRLLHAKGLVLRKVSMMPLKRITSMTVQRPAKTRHFDYGKLATTIGRDQRLSEKWSIEFIPHPDEIYAEIRKVLFPDWDIDGD